MSSVGTGPMADRSRLSSIPSVQTRTAKSVPRPTANPNCYKKLAN